MSSRAIPLEAGTLLVLEPTTSEFRRWNGSSLAGKVSVKDWIRSALEAASAAGAPTFSGEEFAEPERETWRLVLELTRHERERFAAAALAATYPAEVCYRIGRRRKPTRYWGTLLLGPWAHAVLNRAAAGASPARRSPRLVAVAPLPANVIPFPNPPKQAR